MAEKETYAIAYQDREDAYIIVKWIDEPYGPNSGPVVSLGSTLKGDTANPTWKVHIPVGLVDDVRLALKFALEDAKPLDKAIKGKEGEYEEAIELHKTYGGD